MESIQLKRNASLDNSDNKSYFSWVLDKNQLQYLNIRLLNLANDKVLFKNSIESIPSVIEDTRLSNITYSIKELLYDKGYFLLSSDFPHEVNITDDIDGSQVRNLAENNEIVHHVYLDKYHHETSPDKDITVVDNATFGDAPIGYIGVDISRYRYDQFHEIYEEEHFATSEFKNDTYVWKSYYGSSS